MKNNCKKYEHWLYLYKEGELSHRQAIKLAGHLKSCSQCEGISRQLGLMNKDVELWKNNPKEMDIQINISGPVINSIRMMGNEKSCLAPSFWDHLLDVFTRPVAQSVSLALVMVMCLSLIFQEASVMQRIAGLEQRMAQNADRSVNNVTIPNAPIKLNRLVKNLELSSGFSGTLNDEQYIVIDKKTVEILLENYQQTRLQNEILLQFIQRQYPDLYELMAKDSLSIQELDRVLYKHKDILTRLKQL